MLRPENVASFVINYKVSNKDACSDISKPTFLADAVLHEYQHHPVAPAAHPWPQT